MNQRDFQHIVPCPECGNGPLSYLTTFRTEEHTTGYKAEEDFYRCTSCQALVSATDVQKQLRKVD